MPRRAFVADLSALTDGAVQIENIANVKRGDDDGTFTFVWEAPEWGFEGVGFTGMIPELSDYPDCHQTMMWATDEAPAWMTKALDKLNLSGVSLQKLLAAVSTVFMGAFVVENGGVVEIEGDDEDEELEYNDDEEEEDDGSVGGWSDDEATGIDHDGDSQMVNGLANDAAKASAIKQLRQDLRAAKAAGFKVGILGEWKGGMDLYVSIAIRISKLGISEQAISAWKLDRSKYFIVLIHYTQYYQMLKALTSELGGYHGKKGVEICVGMHQRYKPTLAQAIGAFSKVGSGMESQGQHVIGGEPAMNGDEVAQPIKENLEGIFISGPLKELLNTRLTALLKYRLRMGFTWDGAEAFYNEHQGRENGDLEHLDERYYEAREPKNSLPQIVTADALVQSTSGAASFPLLTMQFALRHLVRCTEFCLVCHNVVTNDFEALKPYVCSNPLCLYQYMSLGFGPSIEYEIVSQPSVVDLLVSFCYTSARSQKLKEFPDGMNLMVPNSLQVQPPYKSSYHRFKQEMVFDPSETEGRVPLRVGDWVSISMDNVLDREWHARVIETEYYPTVKLSQPISVPIGYVGGLADHMSAPAPPSSSTLPASLTPNRPADDSTSDGNTGYSPPHVLPGNSDMVPISFRIYDANFDEIATDQKQSQLITILTTLPSVEAMKDWLQKNTKVGEEASLKRWQSRISPTALGVLRWIIASNRSCIVALKDDSSRNSGHEKRVHGMPEWTQFRFAMGAPDKEQRFVNSVRETQGRLGQTQYPTLFAFHGSPLHNWHSIIREGLHFNETLHGRAFGNGCYHSLDLRTSVGYSGYHQFSHNTPTCWPQSKLKIQTAVCLNEIVNAPKEFVSQNPHLVVAQLDWIQTRYLFVQSLNSGANTNSHHHSSETEVPEHQHPQDPKYTPKGYNKSLIIPATDSSRSMMPGTEDAMVIDRPPAKRPKSKKGTKMNKWRKTSGANMKEAIVLDESEDCGERFVDDASICTDMDDLLALLSDDEVPSQSAKQPNNGKAVAPQKPTRPDAFVPGSLDYTTIPFMPPPSYASAMATKRLQADLNHLTKLQQSTPLEDLGFYIDPDRVENVYQWIVELHSFPEHLPLVKDMRSRSPPLTSIVLELRFGPQYPMSPPWVRVISPRFLGFAQGGGGHITVGGALCMELLTNSGWSAVNTIESVLLQVRMEICEESPPARLERYGGRGVYAVNEAKEAFVRACRNHGWEVPTDFRSITDGE